MSFTRFNYDEARTIKKLQQSTDPGRWILNTPGYGDTPCYIEDPNIRIQTWGGNLMTNSLDVENDLLGINKRLNKDCLEDNYKNYNVNSSKIIYPSNNDLSTGQSRTTNPAWTYKDLEQKKWDYLHMNPQENVCIPFHNNMNTRIIEKDFFTAKRDCVFNEINNELPVSYHLINGEKICTTSNSCSKISK